MQLPEPRLRHALLAVIAVLLAGGVLAVQLVGDDAPPTGPQVVDRVIDDVVDASRLLRSSLTADLATAIRSGGEAEAQLRLASSRLVPAPGTVPAALAASSARSFEALRVALASSRVCLQRAGASGGCSSQAKAAQARSAAAGQAVDRLIPFGTRTPAEVVALIQRPV